MLALVFILALAACGGSTVSSSAPSSAPASQAPASSAPASEAPKAVNWAKTIEIYVPASAGGGTDVIARTLSDYVSKNCDSNLVIVNNTDGGGVVALETVRTAKPDGSKLMVYHTSLFIKHATGKYKEDPVAGFTPISVGEYTGNKCSTLVVRSELGINDLAGFIERAKAEPGKLLMGVEMGGGTEFLSKTFLGAAEIDCKIVEAGSDTDKLTALVGGNIDAAFVGEKAASQYVEAGKCVAVAVTSMTEKGERGQVLLDVPSFIEQGVNFTWGSNVLVLGPKDMDPDLVEYIHELFEAAAAADEVNEVLGPMGNEMRMTSVEKGQQIFEEECAKYVSLIS